MSEFWGYDFKKGWIEETNFIDDYCNLNNESDLSKVLNALGYRDGSGFYQIEDTILGNPIQLYELHKPLNANQPSYIVEFCPAGSDIIYFTARNMPSLIELLNKLSPLVHSSTVCNKINDDYNDKND